MVFIERPDTLLELKSILEQICVSTNKEFKRGIYIYGNPGIGKSSFISNALDQLGYSMVRFGINDTSKSILGTIGNCNMSNIDVMSMLTGKPKKIVVVIDDVDHVGGGDKSTINTIIKILRPKRTKKQMKECICVCPVICIGDMSTEKKSRDFLNSCHPIRIYPFSDIQIRQIVMESHGIKDNTSIDKITNLCSSGDLRRVEVISNMGQIYGDKFDIDNNDKNFLFGTNTDNNKEIVKNILFRKYCMSEYTDILNETDRTIVGLMWHENVVDILEQVDVSTSIPLYDKILHEICFADYIDRITFQKQIWQFNEMSPMIKTFYGNKIFHDGMTDHAFSVNPVRFTKILTKYSTEYNNHIFIQSICQKMCLDKKDMLLFFVGEKITGNLINYMTDINISKLDINRVLRYFNALTAGGGSRDTDTISETDCADYGDIYVDVDVDIEH